MEDGVTNLLMPCKTTGMVTTAARDGMVMQVTLGMVMDIMAMATATGAVEVGSREVEMGKCFNLVSYACDKTC
jgi:hypothetical protein